jgi:hypothetical protein
MNLPVGLTRTFSRSLLTLKKDSPHIFFVAGVVGSVASTVMACRATLKLSSTLDDIQVDLKNIKELKENVVHSNTPTLEGTNYSVSQYDRDVLYIYAKASLRITRLYAPSVIVGAASITALTGAHVQMTRRNAALMAAYAAVQEAYDNYRDRVREVLGEDAELDIYHAAETEVVEKKQVKSADPNKWSPYARFFDEYSDYWEKDPELNKLFVQCQQNFANNLLRSRGHIFLNEVYDMLGLSRNKAGAVVGWVLGPDGDNFVDFGIYEAYNARFVSGNERSVLLDFNVDGVIFDKI